MEQQWGGGEGRQRRETKTSSVLKDLFRMFLLPSTMTKKKKQKTFEPAV